MLRCNAGLELWGDDGALGAWGLDGGGGGGGGDDRCDGVLSMLCCCDDNVIDAGLGRVGGSGRRPNGECDDMPKFCCCDDSVVGDGLLGGDGGSVCLALFGNRGGALICDNVEGAGCGSAPLCSTAHMSVCGLLEGSTVSEGADDPEGAGLN